LCHSEPFVCHSERSEESQDKLREESLRLNEVPCAKSTAPYLIRGNREMPAPFVIPAPLVIPVKTGIQRGKLRRESRGVWNYWIPAPRLRGDKFTPAEAGAGMTEVVTLWQDHRELSS
jgi:hypothetical protein